MRASRRYRPFGAPVRSLFALGLMLGVLQTGRAAHASVTLLLEEPYGEMGSMNPTGHAAIYLDHVFAATPLSLRACRPDEMGVVISRYDGITGHDWVAMPLIPYLYSVEHAADIPVTVRRAEVFGLRDTYRRTHLQSVAPDRPDGKAPDGNWYELVGSAFNRSIFGFQLRSTPEQDAELMALLNDRRNSELYNGMFRNCADFARVTLNRFYPHMVRRNFIADLGLTTPKSVARALSHYAAKHPETELQTWMVSQLSGDLPRSQATQGVAEGLIKEYGLPLVVISPVTTAVVLVAYVGHGRFAEPRKAPVLNLRPGLMMEGAITWAPVSAPSVAAGTATAAASSAMMSPAIPAPPVAVPAKASNPSATAPVTATLVRGTLD